MKLRMLCRCQFVAVTSWLIVAPVLRLSSERIRCVLVSFAGTIASRDSRPLRGPFARFVLDSFILAITPRVALKPFGGALRPRSCSLVTL